MKRTILRTMVFFAVLLVLVTPNTLAATANSGDRTQCDPVCCFWVGNELYSECHNETFNCIVWCDLAIRCLGGFMVGDVDVDNGQVQYFQVNKGSYPVIDCKPAVVTGASAAECATFADGCQTWSVPPYLGCNGIYYEVVCKYSTGVMQIISQTTQIARGN